MTDSGPQQSTGTSTDGGADSGTDGDTDGGRGDGGFEDGSNLLGVGNGDHFWWLATLWGRKLA